MTRTSDIPTAFEVLKILRKDIRDLTDVVNKIKADLLSVDGCTCAMSNDEFERGGQDND